MVPELPGVSVQATGVKIKAFFFSLFFSPPPKKQEARREGQHLEPSFLFSEKNCRALSKTRTAGRQRAGEKALPAEQNTSGKQVKNGQNNVSEYLRAFKMKDIWICGDGRAFARNFFSI